MPSLCERYNTDLHVIPDYTSNGKMLQNTEQLQHIGFHDFPFSLQLLDNTRKLSLATLQEDLSVAR